MSTKKTKLEVVLGGFLMVFVLPGLAYIGARMYFLDLLDEVTFNRVPNYDRCASLGLTFLASLGYGLGAWYGETMGWSFASFLAVISVLNGFPLVLAGLGHIELRQSQDQP